MLPYFYILRFVPVRYADTGLTLFVFVALVLLLALPLLRFRFHAFVAEFSVGSQSVA
jgi:hypothetical protein